MRLISGLACAVLILFALLQANDPDWMLWAAIYGAGAAWLGVAALWPAVLLRRGAVAALALSGVAGLAGLIWYWPRMPGWWHQSVWWESEAAREGMGMMIVAASLVLVGVVALVQRRRSLSRTRTRQYYQT